MALGAPASWSRRGQVDEAEDLKIRASLDGEVVNDQAVTGSGVGEYWGFPITSMPAAGDWLFELLDTSGTVLASARSPSPDGILKRPRRAMGLISCTA